MYMCSTFSYWLYTSVRPREEEDARYAEELEVDGDTLPNTIYHEDDDDDEMEEG